MLFGRLLKRFFLALISAFLALVLVNTAVLLPTWAYLLTIPFAAMLTFLYWRSFSSTTVCPTCNGIGKVQVKRGREVESDVCYTCDGEGRVPTLRTGRY